ncbi:MAG: DMT family transporter [Bacteroidales bacterium]|nr:DMT family transporter [Bacteroidales bacterium]
MNQRKAYVYAGLAIFFWSTVATVFKIALKFLDPLNLVMYASFTSFVALFIIVLVKGKLNEIRAFNKADIGNSMILGFLNPFLYYIILFKAYSLLPAQVAQPLNMVWPILLVFLSIPFLKQKIRLSSFIALFISFAGVFLISSQGDVFHFGKSNPIGVMLAVGSSLIWSFFFIFNVRDKRDEELKLLLNFFFSSVFIVMLNLITGNFKVPAFEGIAAAIYIGLFEMGLTFLFWLKALSLSRSTDRVSNYVYLAPFISLIFIHYFLGEKIYGTTIMGLFLIVSGIIYQKIRSGK